MSAVKKPFATPCTECTFASVNVGLVFILCQYVDLTCVLHLSIDKNKMIFPCLELSSLLSKFSRKQKKSTLYHRSMTLSDICQNELAWRWNLRRLLLYRTHAKQSVRPGDLENKLQLQIQSMEYMNKKLVWIFLGGIIVVTICFEIQN